ncbi:MAG: c-type cytochrome biogenesis protein CcsB [Clostridia bacterium]|nr:c-type cytochrome biogenesis protein CcsB [Clostridia bacterium]
MLKLEVILFWVAVGLYAGSTLLYLYSLVYGRDKYLRPATRVALSGIVPHSAALIIRWVRAGHGPYLTYYESFGAFSWFAVAFFLYLQYRNLKFRSLGIVVMPLSFIMIGLAVLSSPDILPLPATFATYWLIVHVIFAMIGYGATVLATAFGILYLLKQRKQQQGQEGGFWQRIPGLGSLDELSYQNLAFGFIALTIMIIAGAIWAKRSWGRYWGWDPIETWSLISWLVYGSYLHLRITYRWKGTRAAWFTIFALVVLVFHLFGLNLVYQGSHAGVWLIK